MCESQECPNNRQQWAMVEGERTRNNSRCRTECLTWPIGEGTSDLSRNERDLRKSCGLGPLVSNSFPVHMLISWRWSLTRHNVSRIIWCRGLEPCNWVVQTQERLKAQKVFSRIDLKIIQLNVNKTLCLAECSSVPKSKIPSSFVHA